MTDQGNIEWGDRVIFRKPLSYEDERDMEDIAEAIRQTRQRMEAEILGMPDRPRPQRTWRDRLTLAWSVLRGRITWDDIQ